VNDYQAEAIRVQLEAERRQLNALKRAYTESLRDVKIKILQLQQRKPTPGTAQTIQYQLGYAYAMEQQLTDILDKLNAGVVANVDEYLRQCYENGFYGTAYTLYGQGIPVSIGVDQRAMGEAVKTSTAGLKFSERLYGENLNELKERYLATLARGIGSGWNYSKIAESLALDTGISLRRAYTIARTEGARVYATARQHGMEAAKAKGADIVKEWSASLDLRTRPLHGRLDGQIREIEEPFEIDGMKAMRPLDFGLPHMDINCRCVALERARWAVEAEKAGEATRTKWDGEMGQIVAHKPYSEWLDGYKKEHPELFEMHSETLKSGAESGIIKTSTGVDSFERKTRPSTIEEDLKATNPSFSTAQSQWTNNCQRCVPAYEMRRRGYDVTAKPQPQTDPRNDRLSIKPWEAWKMPKPIAFGSRADIEKLMAEWGDGARAQIKVIWASGTSGHTFVAEQQGGKTRFIDPQTGDDDCGRYFSEIERSKGWNNVFWRMDNLTPSDLIDECCDSVRG